MINLRTALIVTWNIIHINIIKVRYLDGDWEI